MRAHRTPIWKACLARCRPRQQPEKQMVPRHADEISGRPISQLPRGVRPRRVLLRAFLAMAGRNRIPARDTSHRQVTNNEGKDILKSGDAVNASPLLLERVIAEPLTQDEL